MVVHVVPSVAKESSGPSYSVVRLCESLLDAGEGVALATLDAGSEASLPPFARLFAPGRGPRRLGRSPALRRWLAAEVRSGRADIVQSHGLWRMSCVYPAWAVGAGAAKLIVAPRGTLSRVALSYSAGAKRLFWPVLQRPALRRAACFHATAESEYEDIRRCGFRQPVALIPNGVDVPRRPVRAGGGRRRKTLLCLARMHPVKGVDTLIDAWRVVQDRYPQWQLVIAGNDAGPSGRSGYVETLRRRAAMAGAARVTFAGELLGPAKGDAYHDADVYVLPSRWESFGMTVAEALAAGTPVIATRATPWRRLEAEGAGWCIDAGAAPLAACLRSALAADEPTLRAMGERGRRWMQSEFSWADVGRRVARTCDWLRGGGAAPAWVRVR